MKKYVGVIGLETWDHISGIRHVANPREANAEFPARITVTFDSTISRHLPLDIIWATLQVVSKWMLRSA